MPVIPAIWKVGGLWSEAQDFIWEKKKTKSKSAGGMAQQKKRNNCLIPDKVYCHCVFKVT
jgi:hypothetical protein